MYPLEERVFPSEIPIHEDVGSLAFGSKTEDFVLKKSLQALTDTMLIEPLSKLESKLECNLCFLLPHWHPFIEILYE